MQNFKNNANSISITTGSLHYRMDFAAVYIITNLYKIIDIEEEKTPAPKKKKISKPLTETIGGTV